MFFQVKRLFLFKKNSLVPDKTGLWNFWLLHKTTANDGINKNIYWRRHG